MAIRFVTAWNGYHDQQIVTGLSSSEESRLIGLGFAVADLDGPDNSPVQVFASSNPLNGGMTIFGSDGAVALEIPKSGYENKITATDHLDYLPFAENSQYVFAKTVGVVGRDGIVYRIKKSDGSISDGVGATTLKVADNTTVIAQGVILSMWAWEDFQLLQIKEGATGKCFLYKSIDNFATVGANAPLYNDACPVHAIGWNSTKASEAGEISIMAHWSLARGKNRRGEDLIVFGQYNVNGSRTPGGASDWSNVLCSRQGGDAGTWETIVEANTAGSTMLRHCHAVMQDPYTAEFYIFYGDQQTSGIYVWDGVFPLPANTPPSQAANYRGWRGMDQTNNPNGNYNTGQITSVVFLPNEIIVPVDHGVTDARGVYTLSRDLKTYSKIFGGTDLNHSLYSCVLCPVTGAIVASELIEPGGTDVNNDYTLWVWTATKAGKYRDWKRAGRYMMNTGLVNNRSHSIFRVLSDGTIYMGSANGAGKGLASTAVCKVSGVISGDPEVLHPVYWVDPIKGLDTNSGKTPSAPWKTLNYALRGNRVPTSSLVNVAKGVSDEGTSAYTIALNVATQPAQLNHPLIVRGAGRKATVCNFSNVAYGLTHGATAYPIKFTALSLVNLAAGSIWSSGAAAGTVKAEFSNVCLKSASYGLAVPSGKLSLNQAEVVPATTAVRGNYAATLDIEITSTLVVGGQGALTWTGDSSSRAVLEHVSCQNSSAAGVIVNAAASVLPTVKNCAFDTSVAGVSDSRTVKTSANGIVDYNVYKTANSTLVGGDQNSRTAADLKLIGTTGVPKADSPVILAGTPDVSATVNAVGDAFGSPRNAGAF